MEPAATAATLSAAGILLAAAGLWLRQVLGAREARLHHFVGQYRQGDAPLGEEAARSDWQSALAKQLNRFFARRDFVQATRIELLRAGLQIKPTQFFLFRLVLALVGGLLLAMLLHGQGIVLLVVGALLGVAGGFLLVRPFLDLKKRKRLDAFEKHFADALDIMIGGLEAGASLTAAVELVSREMPPPLSVELARVLRDASLGMSFEEAFKAMHERLPSDDLGMLVSAISVQSRVGGNLATVLRTLGDTVRERLRIRGDIKTLTAQQKMTGYLVTGIPFFMVGMLLLINRSYMIQIFHPGLQRILALGGAVLIVFGNLIIRRILRIEV